MENLNSRFETLCNELDKSYKPEFKVIFRALYSIDEEQKEIFETTLWHWGNMLPDKPDIDKIKQAINKAGFGADKVLYNDFIRYAQIVIDSKRLLKDVIQPVVQRKETVNQNEWLFVKIELKVPEELTKDFIIPRIEADAQEGKGLFSNVTNIQEEDEFFDELLKIDQYGLKGSHTKFYDELIKYNVIGNNGFLNNDFAKGLFTQVNNIVSFINDYTNKPIKIKNYIKEEITKLDDIPIWGLFMQILVLNGVFKWFEGIELNEGDKGFNEAQSLFYWITMKLIIKERDFCYTPYSDGDKQRLKPLCNYLYSTEVGKAVQNHYFGDSEPQQANYDKTTLPKELNTEKAKALLQKLIDGGFCDEAYKWNKSKSLLAYFADKASEYLNIGKGQTSDKIPKTKTNWKPFEALFSIKDKKEWKKASGLSGARNDYQKTGSLPMGSKDIDKIF